jgi:hypothetical protein
MKLPRFAVAVAVAFGSLGAGAAADYSFPPNAPLELVVVTGDGNPRTVVLAPQDKRNVRLRAWLARNQTGWSTYLATPPGKGILVSGGELRLHFVGASVLACPLRKGCVYKKIREDEYAFLRSEA